MDMLVKSGFKTSKLSKSTFIKTMTNCLNLNPELHEFFIHKKTYMASKKIKGYGYYLVI